MEAFNQALAIAHDEDVSAWVEAIAHWMGDQQIKMIPLVKLQKSLELDSAKLLVPLDSGTNALTQAYSVMEITQLYRQSIEAEVE